VADDAVATGASRGLRCPSCAVGVSGRAGASALRSSGRRARRSPVVARWIEGGIGEPRPGDLLERRLAGHGVRVLHERRIPARRASDEQRVAQVIDHLAIGAGGLTVIASRVPRGPVRVARRGLLAARRELLLIGREDRTDLVASVTAHVDGVRAAAAAAGWPDLDVHGALWANVDEPCELDGVLIARGEPIAALAARAGGLDAASVAQLWRRVGFAFPAA
jgi:hypothetical protein